MVEIVKTLGSLEMEEEKKLKGEQSDHPYPQMSSLLRASP